MIKRNGLWYAIKYYYVIPFLLLGIIFTRANNFIFQLSCKYMHLSKPNIFYHLYKLAVPIGLATIWLIIVFVICRDRRYKYLTGRNLNKDIKKYGLNYQQLTDSFRYDYAEPHKLDTSIFKEKKTDWKNSFGLIFGYDNGKLIKIPSESECNISIFGPPGSSKTAGLAIVNAITFSGSVVAIDIKNDIYGYVSQNSNRKILRFCPDSPTALKDSVRFDPFCGIDNMSLTDRKLYLESMAIILIPDDGGTSGAESYFISRARKMFQGITHLILHTNPNASFPDVIHTILQGNIFEFVTTAMKSDCEPAKELLASLYGNTEKNVASAFDTLTTALVQFSNPILDELLSKSENCISIESLDRGSDLYLQISQEHLDAYAGLFTLLLEHLSMELKKRQDSSTGIKNRPILMLLDEFPQLTFSYKLINSNLSTLRSKSVICMLIQQNLSQLQHRYKETGARTILGNCNYQIILGSNDIVSSKFFSDMFGDKRMLKISYSETESSHSSTGISVQEIKEKVFQPEYFGDLPADNKMIIYFKGKYCECQKLNCYKD